MIMISKIKITGEEGRQKIFLDEVQIFPTDINITMSHDCSSLVLTFEDIHMEGDFEVKKVREFTEKIKL